MNPDFLGALLIGLVGAGHCMGMCGGIASLLSLGSSSSKSSPTIPLFYNLGRLSSYALIGALVGGAISGLSELSGLAQSLAWLRFVAAIFMILVALYIAKWWQGLLIVEKMGQHLWKFISPAGKSLLPLKKPIHSLPFFFFLVWLPFWLFYSSLTFSSLSCFSVNVFLIFLSFFFVPLPSLLSFVFFSIHFLYLHFSFFFFNISFF
ncbi:sulfite exporter TauE/SafE family protein, partial [Vibrio parahaemolyticus]|uniref:sulfite exporter TauE/SafE family protein n=1 Tax=Vibrio parahaemolyticus TaxID=670 RepID=UPI00128EAE36